MPEPSEPRKELELSIPYSGSGLQLATLDPRAFKYQSGRALVRALGSGEGGGGVAGGVGGAGGGGLGL
ncbi:hypothetical protein Pmar_PMAR021172 [Perkinsus marinus ATCC 50983]|uniref:Uncharacterized protein n=1 Tax=Perkinsus marinus (strain ATCC 50983 / TXsc) TaxID=423536 RepID=C5KM58_PERM5|nr:hypothetical protein Pmar_PMAR021172 [Perkinsus marinus ATCC 50983]EER14419.1 hypothetical protein Pmar_PMAR021172 [Perkinsus marinus ATCC 50983]|eukprot:XP_002782624.1 hypothetical protein Pmar_PMAR021172 [Perkinsus marinus ATCC 50983]